VALNSTRAWGGPDPVEPTPPVDGRHQRVGIARNVLYLALGQVGTTTLATGFSAALARTLGASDFGLYFLVNAMATPSYIIVEWRQPMLLVREVTRDPQRVGELLGTGLALRVLGAAIVSVPLLLIASLLGYGASTVSILALSFVAMLPRSLAQGFGAVLRGFDRMDRDVLVSVLNSAVGLALVLAALARGGGLAAVGLCQLAAGAVSLVVARQLYERLHAKPLALTRGMARHLWRGGAAIVSLAAVQAMQPYLDVVILSKLVPPDAVGFFGVARIIMGTLLAPAVILATASFPQLSRAAGAPDRFGADVRNALRPMMLIGALGSAGTYLFAQIVVEVVYGRSHYLPAVTILQVFSPVMFLLFVDVILGRALLAASRAKALAVVKVASVVVSTALDVVLIPWFQARHGNGGIGVVVAFALSELVVFAGVVAIMPRGVLRVETVVEAAKTIAAAAGTVLLLRSIPGLPPAAGILLTVVVFFAVAFALRLIHRSDLALLGDMARRRYGPGVGHTSADK
jgi:O-antigen/teichoic acid export membrane protein